MKNLNIIYVILFLLCLTISCTQEKDESIIELDQETNIIGLAIKEILPLPNNLSKHTILVANKIKYLESSPNIDKSFIVSYQDCATKAIYTPLDQKLKSSTELFHVYFERNGLVSKFDLLISTENLNEYEKRFTYLTIEGDLIAQFDVGIDDGLISNVQVNHLKGWGDRFENCVEWVFDHMNTWDTLTCMALGPICAGGIAAMCAVAATEEMFEETDN